MHTLYLAPAGSGVGLTSIALGLVRSLDHRGVRVAFHKPIGQGRPSDHGPERSTHFIRSLTDLDPTNPIPLEEAEALLADGEKDHLLERVLSNYRRSAAGADVVIVEGLVPTTENPVVNDLNVELVKTLSAEVLLAISANGSTVAEIDGDFELAGNAYGGVTAGRIIGCILNRVSATEHAGDFAQHYRQQSHFLHRHHLELVGAIPDHPELAAPRTIDIARELGAEILNAGEIETRRVRRIALISRTVPNALSAFKSGSILVTPVDRSDVLIAVSLAAMNGTAIAGLILTGDMSDVDERVVELCRPGLATGLPILRVKGTSWETATQLAGLSAEIAADDLDRVRESMEFFAQHIDAQWIADHARLPVEARMSPAAFCFKISEMAMAQPKRIVLPEGEEPRTIRAAITCTERAIARCVLLGDPETIRRTAAGMELQLPDALEMIDPQAVRGNYVAPLVELRRHKGITEQIATDVLEDAVYLGTMMLALGEVDGLVSGAVHSSANTIRPALQLIKTKPGAKVVSSVFFMCLPDQVLVYGDCAVNPDPDAETLADIAIQSAESAERFGIPARVAMISYSTLQSGSGVGVEKVREATRLAREKRPDLLLDGPLQYDAAAIPDVAATKAPDSPVAGKATVFVFPDLDTGNTTYKAVQRSANVISIGPMLQGLRRPVNDLSRGALVEDIVYTIAITAIQAQDGAAADPGT